MTTSPAREVEGRASRETQRLAAIIDVLQSIAEFIWDADLPDDIRRRLLHVVVIERLPLAKAIEALGGYREAVAAARQSSRWVTSGDQP